MQSDATKEELTSKDPRDMATETSLRDSETLLLKIVEKRLRDEYLQEEEEAYEQWNTKKEEEEQETKGPTVKQPTSAIKNYTQVPATPVVQAATRTSKEDSEFRESLDDLTLQKIVNVRLGRGGLIEETENAENTTNGQNEGQANGQVSEKGPVTRVSRVALEPGAYNEAPGSRPVRAENLRYSRFHRDSNEADEVFKGDEAMLEDLARSLEPVDTVQCPYDTGGEALRNSKKDMQLGQSSSAQNVTIARLVREESNPVPLTVAEECTSSRTLRPEDLQVEEQKYKKSAAVCLIISVLGICALGLLLAFFLGPESPKLSTLANMTETIIPTMSPEECIGSLLPTSTVSFLVQHPASPQYEAFQWLIADPNLQAYSQERIRQRFALATIYYSTDGPNWRDETNWMSYSDHECSWFHQDLFEDKDMYMGSNRTAKTFELSYDPDAFPCSQNDTGGFEHLWLYKNRLNGRLPIRELSLLSTLKSMALFGNPELKIVLTSEIGELRTLEALEFSSMDVAGHIPTEIGLLTNLKSIMAATNQIEGTIPTEYGQLHQLKYSMLSQNRLSGSLPTELALMTSLEWLYVYDNQLTGSMPSELGRLTAMKFMVLKNNRLTGPVPTEFGKLRLLDLLALSDNLLIGTLPTELGLLTSCQQGFSMNRNQFVGTLPTELGAMTNITGIVTGSGTYGLDLGGNRLVGTLPSELGRLSLLVRLDLSDNLLTGRVPPDLENMVSLETFTVIKNDLSGSIPAGLCRGIVFNCSSLLCGCNNCDCL